MSITADRPVTRPAYRLTARGVLAGEWTKFWSLRSTWITLGVSAVLLVAFGVIAALTIDPDGTQGPGPGSGASDAVSIALSGSTLAALAVGVLGVLLAAGEYTTGMIRSTLTAVPSRLPVLWSKAVIVGGVATLLMALGAVSAFVIGSPLLADGITALGLGDDGVLRSLLGAGLYLGVVAVLGVALGILVRSAAGGIAILAASLLIVPGLTSLLPDSFADAVTPYLPSNAGSALMSLTTSDGSLSAAGGLGVLAVYAVVLLGAAAYRLTRSDA